MHLVLLCATQRGYRFLDKLSQLASDQQLSVVSFPETAWEPPFLDDIRGLAESRGVRFYETRQISKLDIWQTLPDLMLVVSWRYLIPPEVYQQPRLGSFVFHDSLLPAYRGFSPTVWAVINGEDHTGVTLFEMAEDVDSGDIVDQEHVPIAPDETIADVMEHVTRTYLTLLERNLSALLDGTAPRHPQDHNSATFTCKRNPEDNRINWTASTQQIYDLIRATTYPYTAAYTYLKGKRLRIWSAERLPKRRYIGSIPGRVVEFHANKGAVVLTGDGRLLLTRVQWDEGEIVTADRILNSLNYTLGN
jgi:methionyl-tRNA formyltransferase